MIGSEILDVAIGLILMFLLLSLVCSSIKEALETVLNQRSKDLEHGIREMTGDLRREHIVPLLYQHPLIDGLYQGDYQKGKTRNLPSYISSRTFAMALIDLLAKSSKPEITQVTQPGTHGALPSPREAMQAIQNATAALPPDSHLRGALLPLLAAAEDDLVHLQHEIESWYDGVMDRVSGWYKKRTQIILAIIGLSLAIAMNVDTVAIVRYLNTSQTERQLLIGKVQHFQETHTSAAETGPVTSDLVDPMGWIERQGGVPLGWLTSPLPGQTDADFQHDWRRPPDNFSRWLFKAAGILFTAFAVTLGAPFWFDLLNRFMVVRSTVKPDEKSPKEKSKA